MVSLMYQLHEERLELPPPPPPPPLPQDEENLILT
jgi:hypothetical protein